MSSKKSEKTRHHQILDPNECSLGKNSPIELELFFASEPHFNGDDLYEIFESSKLRGESQETDVSLLTNRGNLGFECVPTDHCRNEIDSDDYEIDYIGDENFKDLLDGSLDCDRIDEEINERELWSYQNDEYREGEKWRAKEKKRISSPKNNKWRKKNKRLVQRRSTKLSKNLRNFDEKAM